jgi:hypothetical protein
MSALTLLVFCLPPDSGEKVTMGITVLLAFSVFLLRMGEDLPETSEYIPLLSKYAFYNFLLSAEFSFKETVSVFWHNFHTQKNDIIFWFNTLTLIKYLDYMSFRKTMSYKIVNSVKQNRAVCNTKKNLVIINNGLETINKYSSTVQYTYKLRHLATFISNVTGNKPHLA